MCKTLCIDMKEEKTKAEPLTPRDERIVQSCSDTSLKLIVLIALVIQKVSIDLSMRYSRTRPEDKFITSTVVLLPEVVKLFVCLTLVYWKESSSWGDFSSILYRTVIKEPKDTLKVCIPSFIFVLQNNLRFISVENLDAPVYQITNQFKLFTTAVFSVLILKRKLTILQWSSLIVLIVGIFLAELRASTSHVSNPNQNVMIGLLSGLLVCCMSGFASVYFEKILKGSEISIWMRNIQLSCVSIPMASITCITTDWNNIADKGFFFGYDLFVVFLICLQASGGLIVAMVIKYADNIIKGFATSLSISIGCIFSMYFFDFVLTVEFVVGAVLVIFATFAFSYSKKNDSPNSNKV